MSTDDDRDVERHDWTPTGAQVARYLKRETELARHNRGVLERAYDGPRRVEVITNGLPMWRGFHAIGVIRGGAEAEDTLHSLRSFGAGGRKAAVVRIDISSDREAAPKLLTLRVGT